MLFGDIRTEMVEYEMCSLPLALNRRRFRSNAISLTQDFREMGSPPTDYCYWRHIANVCNKI